MIRHYLVFIPEIQVSIEEIECLEITGTATSPDQRCMMPDQVVQPWFAGLLKPGGMDGRLDDAVETPVHRVKRRKTDRFF